MRLLLLLALSAPAADGDWEYRPGTGFVNPATMERKTPEEFLQHGEHGFLTRGIFDRPDAVAPDVHLVRQKLLLFLERFLLFNDPRALGLFLFRPFPAQYAKLVGNRREFTLDGGHLPVKHHRKFPQFKDDQISLSAGAVAAVSARVAGSL